MILSRASTLIKSIRASGTTTPIERFLAGYHLSSDEGIALMCLAESLLRIPDTATRDSLIRDKLISGSWRQHYGKSPSLFVNAATFGLIITGKILTPRSQDTHGMHLTDAFKRLMSKGGEPIVRQAVSYAMKLLGEHFVMGQTITAALQRAAHNPIKGYTYSFDMLGEAAMTQADADQYYAQYESSS